MIIGALRTCTERLDTAPLTLRTLMPKGSATQRDQDLPWTTQSLHATVAVHPMFCIQVPGLAVQPCANECDLTELD